MATRRICRWHAAACIANWLWSLVPSLLKKTFILVALIKWSKFHLVASPVLTSTQNPLTSHQVSCILQFESTFKLWVCRLCNTKQCRYSTFLFFKVPIVCFRRGGIFRWDGWIAHVTFLFRNLRKWNWWRRATGGCPWRGKRLSRTLRCQIFFVIVSIKLLSKQWILRNLLVPPVCCTRKLCMLTITPLRCAASCPLRLHYSTKLIVDMSPKIF